MFLCVFLKNYLFGGGLIMYKKEPAKFTSRHIPKQPEESRFWQGCSSELFVWNE